MESSIIWQSKELEKGILVKKSLLISNPAYTKLNPTFQPSLITKAQTPNQIITQLKPQLVNPNKPIQLKPRELGKCGGGVKNLGPQSINFSASLDMMFKL
jgi:hypothetical protein